MSAPAAAAAAVVLLLVGLGVLISVGVYHARDKADFVAAALPHVVSLGRPGFVVLACVAVGPAGPHVLEAITSILSVT